MREIHGIGEVLAKLTKGALRNQNHGMILPDIILQHRKIERLRRKFVEIVMLCQKQW